MAVELQKLKEALFIEPCKYLERLANVVMVTKASGGWRMCLDYTDLNKACSNDFYPLPQNDQLVDSTSGHSILSFMDAFSGYHKIFMHLDDKAKIAFITTFRVYSNVMMPFDLKNVGGMHKRLVDYVFVNQKGRKMEVYVDDSINKSKPEGTHQRSSENI
ncbi:Transposon Ty3-I Gag-Pol polyprotein [Bienertia sinuspersici]